MSKFKSFIFALAFAATSLMALPQAASAAGSASLGLSTSGSRVVGGTFSATVTENSGGTAVNGVQADLNYDSTKIQFLSKACGSAFDIAAPSGAGSLACATINAQTGGQVVGVVSFRVLAAGAGTIGFQPSSQITASDGQGTNVWNGDTSGISYSFSTPVAAAPVAAAPAPAPNPAPVVKAAAKKAPAAVKAAPPVRSVPGWQTALAWIGMLIAVLIAAAVTFRKQLKANTKNLQKSFKGFKKSFKKGFGLKFAAAKK